MLTRLHISSFIGLTIGVWLLALWIQGMPVLSADFIKPFGLVVGAITLVVGLFNKYAWAWAIFRGWYIKRPDLRGTWKVEFKSSWINPETNEPSPEKIAYVAIRQSLTSLSFRLMTDESRSVLIAHSIEQQEEGDLFKLVGVYRNEPRIEFQGDRSEIHHGAFSLEIHGTPVIELEGHYWTDRGTKGSMKLIQNKPRICDTYEQAKRCFEEKEG